MNPFLLFGSCTTQTPLPQPLNSDRWLYPSPQALRLPTEKPCIPVWFLILPHCLWFVFFFLFGFCLDLKKSDILIGDALNITINEDKDVVVGELVDKGEGPPSKGGKENCLMM